MTIYKALPEPLHKSSWLNRRSVFFVVFAFVFSATLSYLFTRNPSDTSATLVGFSAGNIINDYTMGNYNTMTEAQIQAFLDSKDACSQKGQDYYNYLVNYYNVQKGYSTRTHSWHFENGHFVCLAQEKFGENEGEFGSGETAAHIIWQAAQDYHINPQVLLVTLQKEQTLLNDPIPRSGQYNSAMGFGCFDDNQGCRDKYAGFKKQIRSAAALYHEVLSGGWSNFTVGVNYIQYNTTDSGCGGSKVNIENLATAALYRYTPYQPNAATIAAGTGTAYCGAYGNRNFYNYFTEWFGSTQTTSQAMEIKQRHVSLGGDSGVLGKSTSAINCNIGRKDACVQAFENGVIISSKESGTWEGYGAIRSRYMALGSVDGVLGYPTSAINCNIGRKDACVQAFENGVIISSKESGTWEGYGAIRSRYISSGSVDGVLGYPTGAIESSNGSYVQTYEKGVIVSGGGSAWVMSGDIADRYLAIGGPSSVLGMPIGTQNCNIGRKDACVQAFENGVIISSKESGTWESYGGVRKTHILNGSVDGKYGYPKGAVVQNDSSTSQEFEGGTITSK